MKRTFRQSMRWLHTWSGLVLGWILYFMFVTGSAGYFDNEIDRWMRPEIPFVSPTVSQAQLLNLAEKRLTQVADNALRWSINFPVDRVPYLNIAWQIPANKENGKKSIRGWEKLDPETGQPLITRDTGGGQLLYSMHYALHYMPAQIAYWITSLCAMFMLVALITGIIIHIRIFKDFFTFRPEKQQRSWTDMHNLLSVLPLPFHLMITYSGLILLMFTTMPSILSSTYGDKNNAFYEKVFPQSPLKERAGINAQTIDLSSLISEMQGRTEEEKIRSISIENRGDINALIKLRPQGFSGLGRKQELTYDGISGKLLNISNNEDKNGDFTNTLTSQFYQSVISLHEGLFADVILRWLYFFSGICGAGMIATGIVLWTIKRRKQEQKNNPVSKALILVEYLNVGTIVGLPIAIGVYFWLNRILPVDFEGRANWEINGLFIVWGIVSVYPLFIAGNRPFRKVWVEQLTLAAIIFMFLPLLNVFTSNQHLGITIFKGDWVMAGFDLLILFFGFVFALAAMQTNRKQQLIFSGNIKKTNSKSANKEILATQANAKEMSL